MESYPNTLSEWETLNQLKIGKSISRFGDGEFKIVLGKNAMSQRASTLLAEKFVEILSNPVKDLLVGIPNFDGVKNIEDIFWGKFASDKKLLGILNERMTYGSSFISRPLECNFKVTVEYWDLFKSIWTGKDVVYVNSGVKILGSGYQVLANSWRIVRCPGYSAFDDYERIFKEVMELCRTLNNPLVMSSAGSAATLLSRDVCIEGVQAIDIGHLGSFIGRIN